MQREAMRTCARARACALTPWSIPGRTNLPGKSCVSERNFFFLGPWSNEPGAPERRAYMLVEMLLDFAMPFTSLSKLYKNEGQNHFADPNGHVSTFLHPILIFQATYWALMDSRAPLMKIVTNMIWLLLPVSDSSIIMFGTGGLLLVISHLFAVPASVLWAGLKKKSTWTWEIFIQGLHSWGCCKIELNQESLCFRCTPSEGYPLSIKHCQKFHSLFGEHISKVRLLRYTWRILTFLHTNQPLSRWFMRYGPQSSDKDVTQMWRWYPFLVTPSTSGLIYHKAPLN